MNIADEKLKKLIEEGKVEIDEFGRVIFNEPTEIINISPEPMGPNRDDRKTIIDGKRSSNVMLGSQKIILGNGDFVNVDEFLDALNNAIKDTSDEVIYATKTGKILDPKQIVEVSHQAAGKIVVLDKRNPNFKYVDNREWGVVSAGTDKYLSRGVIIFSNNTQVKLPSGEYVSYDEIKKALSEYFPYRFANEKVVPPIESTRGSDFTSKSITDEDEIYATVTNVKKVKWKEIVIATLLFITAATSMNINDEADVELSTSIEETIEWQQEELNFVDYTIGDKYFLPDNLVLQETSLGGNTEEIGKDWKDPGEYALTGFALVSDGQIIDYIEDFNLQSKDIDLEEFVNKVCEEKGLTRDDFEVMLHFGTNLDGSRAGWVNIEKFHQMKLHDSRYILQKTTVRYDGTAQGFEGVVRINTPNGKAEVPIKDNDGNYCQEGSIMVGSDGYLYVVDKIETKNDTAKFILKNTLLGLAFAVIIDGVASQIKVNKENKEAQDNKNLMKFDNKKSYEDFVEYFTKKKREYDSESKFGKLISRLSFKESFDLLQKMNEDQVNEMFNRISNIHTSDYSYNPSDKITFDKGKIFVEYKAGGRQDITEIVLPIIQDIAADNPSIRGVYDKEIEDDGPKL